MPANWVQPVVLKGETVVLRPMTIDDVDALWEAGQFPELWTWTLISHMPDRAAMEAYVRKALTTAESGAELPFVTVEQATGRVIGSTRYLEVSDPDKTLEIGWTWITPEFQRSRVNTEAKFLMLRHAFETLGAMRVQLKTDERNLKSQTAIARIGAKREGTLRKHRLTAAGHQRSTVYFSILDDEWPEVKLNLEAMLRRE